MVRMLRFSRMLYLSGWLFFMLSVTACLPTATSLFDNLSSATTPINKQKPDTIQQDITPLEIRAPDQGLEQARAILETHFGAFLERDPLGFTWDLPRHIADDAVTLFQNVDSIARNIHNTSPTTILGWVFPLLLISILFGVFLIIDRQFTRLGQRLQAQIHFDISRGLTNVIRALILIVARCIPVFMLIAVSYFPVQALFERAVWSLLFTQSLWLLLAYRAIQGVIVVFLSGQFLNISKEHAQRLERFAVWFTRISIIFWLTLATISITGYREDFYAVVLFAFKIVMALAAVYLFIARQSVLALLPEPETSSIYAALFRTITRYYNWVVGVTIILLMLNAAGYVHAASFILLRSYAILLLVTLALAGAQRLRRFLRTQNANDEDTAQLYAAFEQLLMIVGTVLLTGMILRLLGIYEALVALLKVPFVAIGAMELSFFHLLNVVIIVGSTVLFTRLLKALLNARIYPAFHVEIGVAYATNTLINYTLVVVAFFMSLFALGVHLSAVLVVLASLGVGIGFGLQTLTENLISGFIILFGRSVKKGDFITVNGIYGQVDSVGARNVIVHTPDNVDLLVPSKDIVSGQLTNWTYRDSHVRLHIPVCVSYKSNPRQVQQVLLEAATKHPMILQSPPPEIWLSEFGGDGIHFKVVVYFDCRKIHELTFRGQFNFIVWEALFDAGIQIQLPQRDLHVRSNNLSPEIAQAFQHYSAPDSPTAPPEQND